MQARHGRNPQPMSPGCGEQTPAYRGGAEPDPVTCALTANDHDPDRKCKLAGAIPERRRIEGAGEATEGRGGAEGPEPRRANSGRHSPGHGGANSPCGCLFSALSPNVGEGANDWRIRMNAVHFMRQLHALVDVKGFQSLMHNDPEYLVTLRFKVSSEWGDEKSLTRPLVESMAKASKSLGYGGDLQSLVGFWDGNVEHGAVVETTLPLTMLVEAVETYMTELATLGVFEMVHVEAEAFYPGEQWTTTKAVWFMPTSRFVDNV